MNAGSPKAITGLEFKNNQVRFGNEEISLVDVFRYLGHLMTADCRDDKDIGKQFRRQYADGNMLVRKFLFAPMEA